MTLLNPKLDIVFKKLLTSDLSLLADLINAVLKLPKKQRIRKVDVRNPAILPEEITQKYIILDILATDESGFLYEIEMQIRRYTSYSKRSLYYVSRLYAGQLDSGEAYENLRPVIGIHFLDYEEFPDYPDFHFCFEMRDSRHHGLLLTDDIQIHIFELPKFEKFGDKQLEDSINEWLRFFNHSYKEDKAMRTSYKNPAIQKAFKMLEILSADEETRRLAEMREKALKNERSELAAAKREGIEEGMQKGIMEEKRNAAKILLKMGVLTMEQISEATGLDVEELQKLQKSKKISKKFPFPDSSFDVITLLAVFEHLGKERIIFVEEIFRLLKEGGIVVLTVPDKFVDSILKLLSILNLIDGMSIEEHDKYNVSGTPNIFTKKGFVLKKWKKFQSR